ncbi:MAG: NAD(P)-dependent oxidoreductase, partial [Pseudomonadota bacterium]
MASIAILDDYQDLALTLADWSDLQANHDVTVFREHFKSPDALINALTPFDVVCLMRERTAFGADVIDALPNLKLIVTAGMRNAAVDMDAARTRSIPVCGTPVQSEATAELTIGLMVALARHIAHEAANMKAGGWQSTVGLELAGKTLGIIGLGKLGGKVARVAAALDMKVIAWSQNLTDEVAERQGAKRVPYDALI